MPSALLLANSSPHEIHRYVSVEVATQPFPTSMQQHRRALDVCDSWPLEAATCPPNPVRSAVPLRPRPSAATRRHVHPILPIVPAAKHPSEGSADNQQEGLIRTLVVRP
eukprot:9492557-Pyramimonas_sp.AAC.1